MESLSFSLEAGCGSTETLEEDKELSLAQLEEIDTKTEAVAGRSVDYIYGKTGAVQLVRAGSDKKACDYDTLPEDQEYIKEIKELHAYLDVVKTMVRPGCSPEVLKIALNSISTLFNTLTCVFCDKTPCIPLNQFLMVCLRHTQNKNLSACRGMCGQELRKV